MVHICRKGNLLMLFHILTLFVYPGKRCRTYIDHFTATNTFMIRIPYSMDEECWLRIRNSNTCINLIAKKTKNTLLEIERYNCWRNSATRWRSVSVKRTCNVRLLAQLFLSLGPIYISNWNFNGFPWLRKSIEMGVSVWCYGNDAIGVYECGWYICLYIVLHDDICPS